MITYYEDAYYHIKLWSKQTYIYENLSMNTPTDVFAPRASFVRIDELHQYS